MSIDVRQDLENDVRAVLAEVGALMHCPFHENVCFRVGDQDKERRAYALATVRFEFESMLWNERKAVMNAIKTELEQVATRDARSAPSVRPWRGDLRPQSSRSSHP